MKGCLVFFVLFLSLAVSRGCSKANGQTAEQIINIEKVQCDCIELNLWDTGATHGTQLIIHDGKYMYYAVVNADCDDSLTQPRMNVRWINKKVSVELYHNNTRWLITAPRFRSTVTQHDPVINNVFASDLMLDEPPFPDGLNQFDPIP